MEIKELESRIAKKKSQIEKINKRISKWEAAKSDKDFIKRYECDEKDNMWWNSSTGDFDLTYDEFKQLHWNDYVSECDYEIKRATYDLNDNESTLKKYEDRGVSDMHITPTNTPKKEKNYVKNKHKKR